MRCGSLTRKVTTADWRRVIDMVWRGYTVPVAFKAGGFTDDDQRRALNERTDIKNFLVDISIVASVRGELFDASTTDSGK